MPANYDIIAPIYDRISRLVFGRTIIEAQVCLITYIPSHSRIFVVGGGTGWILEEISAVHSSGLTIDYVESSAEMITLSQKRDYKSNTINFIPSPIENYQASQQYDVIITPFFFDNFTADTIDVIFPKLNNQLRSDGIWLHADFVYDAQYSSLWQKVLLQVMYLFFRMIAHLETRDLIPMDSYFKPGYQILYHRSHYASFIRSTCYRKKG